MTIERKCGHCGSAILAAHAGRKYCSQACYLAGKRKSHERALELRYAAPKPLAKTDVHTVGQRVRVPVSEVREIGGKRVTVSGTAIGTISKVGDVLTVVVTTDGKSRSRRFTAEQLRGASAPTRRTRSGIRHRQGVGSDKDTGQDISTVKKV